MLTGGFLLTHDVYSAAIKGYVIDAEDSSPLANVFVKITGKPGSTLSNSKGYFEIGEIDPGNYLVEFSLGGYLTYKESFSVKQNDTVNLLISLSHLGFRTPVITITDEHPKSKFDDFLELSAVLKDKELQRNLGQTLAFTLKNETGLSIRSMGPAPSRPVFRGLSGDRVLISEDGMKTSDLSSTSPDHSVTVEPFTIERVEVIRGPKVLLKSPTTIGGIINVVRNEVPKYIPHSITLKLGGFGETSNNGFLGSSVIEMPIRNFVLRGEASYRKTADMKTPLGTLKNSDIKTVNLSGGLSFINGFGYIGGSLREYKTDYGIPGGFVGAHPYGVDISMLKRQYNLKFHYDISSKHLDHLDIEASRVYYKHTEYERDDVIGSEFRIINYLGFANLYHNAIGFTNRGVAGVSFEARDFNIGGFVFSPPSKSFNVSAYINEELTAGKKWNFELSVRYNFDRITPQQSIQLSNLDTLYRRIFNTFSVSGSVIFTPFKNFNIGINLSRSSRVPTIEELYSDGPHLAAYSYEIGNPDLEDEKGTGSEVFLYFKNKKTYFMLSGFYNDLSNYIIPRNTGRINFATLLPIYQSIGVGAHLYGIESQFELNPAKRFRFNASLSYTKGEIKGSGSPLPQIPPLRSVVELKYLNSGLTLGVSSEMAASQKQVDEFEEPTSGYVIFGAFGQYSLTTGKIIHNFSLNIDNITNRVYRNHLSRIKSIIPEPGTNLRMVYKLYY
jgi:iron complex outermembrane recepter protein